MIEIEGFLKFIEGLNGIKRPINQRLLFICRVCMPFQVFSIALHFSALQGIVLHLVLL